MDKQSKGNNNSKHSTNSCGKAMHILKHLITDSPRGRVLVQAPRTAQRPGDVVVAIVASAVLHRHERFLQCIIAKFKLTKAPLSRNFVPSLVDAEPRGCDSAACDVRGQIKVGSDMAVQATGDELGARATHGAEEWDEASVAHAIGQRCEPDSEL